MTFLNNENFANAAIQLSLPAILFKSSLIAALISLLVVNVSISHSTNENSPSQIYNQRISSSANRSKLQVMSQSTRQSLCIKARNMFKFGFDSYMKYAFPADELTPLSCGGRYRYSNNPRGDIDNTLGNFSLTLIDSMDGLALLGLFDEFETAVRNVIEHVKLEASIPVSVFEVNIRVLGGLLSSHVICKHLKENSVDKQRFAWYEDELLSLAWQLGKKLLPAFDTKSGLPKSTVMLNQVTTPTQQSNGNASQTSTLPTGVLSGDDSKSISCTACCGTFILEFHTLSYLTGDWSFAVKAFRAMDVLWNVRDHNYDLLGGTIDVETGKWVRKDASIGAGSDSYYEYLLKGYMAFGIDEYFYRFEKHYESIMKFMHQNYSYRSVNMNNPRITARSFMDSLMAFWPATLVEFGSIKRAAEFHELFYQLILLYNQIPEAFTTDLHIYWPDALLRPELAESTYYLYKSTRDPYYLEVAKVLLESLERNNRVKCGYAAYNDLRTGELQDRMDSFFLAETLKYLYLIFEDPSQLPVNLDGFVFSTEAHLIPIVRYKSFNPVWMGQTNLIPTSSSKCQSSYISRTELAQLRSDVQKSILLKRHQVITSSAELLPESSENYVDILSSHFKDIDINDYNTRLSLATCGVVFVNMGDKASEDSVTLAFVESFAKSTIHAEFGKQFIQYLEKTASEQHEKARRPCTVFLFDPLVDSLRDVSPFKCLFALFSHPNKDHFTGNVVIAQSDRHACSSNRLENIHGKVVLVERGLCDFRTKVHNLRRKGALAALIYDESINTTVQMDGTNHSTFPVAFIQSFKASQYKPAAVIATIDRNRTSADSIFTYLCKVKSIKNFTSNETIAHSINSNCMPGTRDRAIVFFRIVRTDPPVVLKMLNPDPGPFIFFSCHPNGTLGVQVKHDHHHHHDKYTSFEFTYWLHYHWDLFDPGKSDLTLETVFSLWSGHIDLVVIAMKHHWILKTIESLLSNRQHNLMKNEIIWTVRDW